jgi:hypothetical protein
LRQRLTIFAETFRALEQVLAQSLIGGLTAPHYLDDLAGRRTAEPLRIWKARGVISPRKRRQPFRIQTPNIIPFSLHL